MLEIIISNWLIILLFFLVAVLYSSVGFGGGTSYIAVLTFLGFAFTEIRSTALLCNIVVVSGNVFLYHQQRLYNWKKIIPLVLFSIPLAFVGGYLKINQTLFFIVLGVVLFIAALSMWLSDKMIINKETSNSSSFLRNSIYGGVIGFTSGIVGIGGGVFLAPLLHLRNWDIPKKIAATASFFILVNSISGLFGQYMNPSFHVNCNLTVILLITVFIGGQIGSRASINFLTPIQLKKATAILIAYISIRILFKYIF